MEWFKKKMRVFLFVCLLFPFYSYAAKISLSISGKIEDHSAMLYFPDGRELPISIDASGTREYFPSFSLNDKNRKLFFPLLYGFRR